MHTQIRRRLALAGLAALSVLSTGLLAGTSQPEAIRRVPSPAERRPSDGPMYTAWIPPGTYTAIVLNSSGDQRRWAVSLMTTSINVPIVVAPGDNVVIEFKDGWKVDVKDEARLVSDLVPFDDSASYNKVGDQPRYVLSAWGIMATGPVQFAYRAVRP